MVRPYYNRWQKAYKQRQRDGTIIFQSEQYGTKNEQVNTPLPYIGDDTTPVIPYTGGNPETPAEKRGRQWNEELKKHKKRKKAREKRRQDAKRKRKRQRNRKKRKEGKQTNKPKIVRHDRKKPSISKTIPGNIPKLLWFMFGRKRVSRNKFEL